MELQLEYLPADALGLPPLARIALAQRPRPSALPGLIIPARLEEIPECEDRFDDDERDALSQRLECSLAPLEPHVAVLDSVRKLRSRRSSLVVTAHPPAFLGGSLLALWKALHAIRLAQELEKRWGTPVAPLFWNDVDAEDGREAHRIHLLNPNLDLTRLGLPGMSAGRGPLSKLALTIREHRLEPIAALSRQILPDTPHRNRALEDHLPREGESLARSFTRVLLQLGGPHGLIVLEPDWIRADLSRALATVVAPPAPHGREEDSQTTLRALMQGTEEVQAACPGLPLELEREVLVYHQLEGAARSGLRPGGEGYRYDEEPGSRTPAELAAEIVQSPLEWSAGRLLRPVVQDLALPVAAFLGGWDELSDHAILGPLRRLTGVGGSPFVPRLSCTLVDLECRQALARLGLECADVLRSRGRLASDRAGKGLAPGPEANVIVRLREIAARAARELAAQRQELAEIDRGLSIQLKRTSGQVSSLVEKLCAKAERVQANREGKERRHLRRLDNTLFPNESPQEEILTPLQLTARFGTDWLGELLRAIDPLPIEHLVVDLVEEGRGLA